MYLYPFVVLAQCTNDDLKFLYSNWVFLFPAILTVFTILIWIFGSDRFLINIKRLFYCLYILGYLIFIRQVDVTGWCNEGPFHISSHISSLFLSMIVAFLIAMAVDNFIISGFIFKEFGIFGAKFVKEDKETQKAVIQYDDYSMVLEKSLESLYYTLDKIHKFFFDQQIIDSIKDHTFDYTKHFTDFLMDYYEYKSEKVYIHVQLYDTTPEVINKLVNAYTIKYDLRLYNRNILKKCLSNHQYGTSRYFGIGKTKLFIITANIRHSKENEMLLISIESRKEINIYDFYPILCCLNDFEIEVGNI